MTLVNTRTNLGLKASLMAPVLAVGILAAAPASAAGLGGVATLGDIQTGAASNIIQVGQRNHRRYGRGYRRGPRAHAHRFHDNRRRARRKRRQKAIVGIGLGLLGAAIIASHHRKNRYHSEPVRSYGGSSYRAAKRKCARVYGEDYVWRSDLVYDRYGDARVCKFVRRAGY